MKKILILILQMCTFLFYSKSLFSQDKAMVYPTLYFKHKSIEYAEMPYSADSALRYFKGKTIDVIPIFRDSNETNKLSIKRAEKVKIDISKYTSTNNVKIQNVGAIAPKVYQFEIKKMKNKKTKKILQSLNSRVEIPIIDTDIKSYY